MSVAMIRNIDESHGGSLEDINPEKSTYPRFLSGAAASLYANIPFSASSWLSVKGYKTLSVYTAANQYIGSGYAIRFVDKNGNVVGNSYYNFSGGSWRDYSIPSGAYYVQCGIAYSNSSANNQPFYYSLKT